MTSCRQHPDSPGTGACATCGDPTCDACRRTDVFGRAACPRCATGAVPAQRVKRPWLAWMLSVVPGLGQVYVGVPERGIVLFAFWCAGIFVLKLGVLGSFLEVLAALAWLGYWFWCSLDAHALAEATNRAGRALTMDEATALGRGRFLGLRADDRGFGVALCILGALLLLQQFAGLVADAMRFAVPVGLLALSAWILWRARRRRRLDEGDTIDVEPEPETNA